MGRITQTKKKFVECGFLGRPWGLKGQITVFWNNGICPVEVGRGVVYSRTNSGDFIPFVVLGHELKGKRFIVNLKGFINCEQVKELCNQKIYLPEDELKKTEKDEFYSYQLIGLKVKTNKGKELGVVEKIFSTKSNDVYEIKPIDKRDTILIPAIETVVLKIDLENKEIIIDPILGLLD